MKLIWSGWERQKCAVCTFSVWTFLTSGHPSEISGITSAGGGTVFFSHRNLGPVNQFYVRSLLALEPPEARSAGFLLVETYHLCWVVVLRWVFWILFNTNMWKWHGLLLLYPSTTLESVQKYQSILEIPRSSFRAVLAAMDTTAAVSSNLGIVTALNVAPVDFYTTRSQLRDPFSFTCLKY